MFLAILPFAAAFADGHDLGPLEMWGGRKAHPAVVNSVTAVPEDPWTLSLRGEWEIVQNRPSPSRGNGGRANNGREGFWQTRTIHRVQVPGCLEDALKDVHSEPEKGRSWFCIWDCSPVMIRGFHYGETWHRKSVKLPAGWKGRRIWLKGIPHGGYFNELFFRIGRTGLKLPVEGFDPEDFVMVGEGGEACYLYLACRKLPNGARHYLIAGLDVMSDTPEAAALLRGAVEEP